MISSERIDLAIRSAIGLWLLTAAGCSCTEPLPELANPFDGGLPERLAAYDVSFDIAIDEAVLPPGCEREVCGNSVDDDCDGVVDGNCTCVIGESTSCFVGAVSSRNVGTCRDGTMQCGGQGEFGGWGACSGMVVPAVEQCDAAFLDEDCDGASNEDCACVEGEERACGTTVGICEAGTQRCENGILTACDGAVSARGETCNGLDDDCDGQIDEGVTRACGVTLGACVSGAELCVSGSWTECMGAIVPTEETCNGIDDDCNGQTDETLSRVCGSDVGACMPGAELCASGVWQACAMQIQASVETCNGLDDDCDGMVDEDLVRECGSAVGICTTGLEVCRNGAFSACEGGVSPSTERCDGQLDENCNGTVDEGCACVSGTSRSCGTDVGQCVAGEQLCTNGTWSACAGEIGALPESCNGADDDCDGVTDEGCNCVTGATRQCGSSVGVCRFGTETCDGSGNWGPCTGAVTGGAETCDGLDNDCNGTTDPGCQCITGATRSCGPSSGQCRPGRETCGADGAWGSCLGAIGPGTETCDGTDNDCDGQTDEGCECIAGATRTCGTDLGLCSFGTETCSPVGTWGSCVGGVPASTELCDGQDNDCDGQTDEGCQCITGAMRNCGTDVGLCEFGAQTCNAQGQWAVCSGGTSSATEVCDGLDNDCDGQTDEGCQCLNGQQRSCGTDVGICVAGIEICNLSGQWGSCTGSVGPQPSELCDGQDNDCDGQTDEGCQCITGATRACGTDVGICQAGQQTCSAQGQWGSCSGAIGPQPSELCDGQDNDCDGQTDEGCGCINGQTRTCGTNAGICVAGTETCNLNGQWGSCTGSVGPQPNELCDGQDNDCDNQTDEGCGCINGQQRSCGTDVGQCVAGSETCNLSGQWGSCVGSQSGTNEVCDAQDNDCDGSTDEGGVCVPPTVMCPAAQSTLVGSSITLMGGGNDPDGGAVAYQWTLVTRPAGSSASLMGAATANATLVPDAAGSYVARLCVTDNEGVQSCCDVSVSATSQCVVPPTPSATGCGTSWDRRPIVEFTPVPAGIDYQLYLDGDSTPYGTVTATGQNYYRPAAPIALGGPPPGSISQVTVRACREGQPTCCSTLSNPITFRMVETCSTPVAPTADNIIFSEYVIDGDGSCAAGNMSCEAGEAIELTNLSNCPIALNGHHFSYCNGTCSDTALRWMNFTSADVIPPRGVYVAIRQQGDSMCSYPFFEGQSNELFGLNVSSLDMEGPNLQNGWFNNGGGAQSQLRIASGAFAGPTSGATLEIVRPYSTGAPMCGSVGFNAIDACGEVSSSASGILSSNQLGRLWRPCDAVVNPNPPSCQ